MITYDYRCLKCGFAWEERKPMVDRDLPLAEPCLKCGAQREDGGEEVIERYLPSTQGLNYSGEKRKVPEAFKDILRRIKSQHAHSTIKV